jgi:hypothetical protein
VSIYTDGLASDWQDWSWNAARDMRAAGTAYSGQYAMAVRLAAWGAVSLWHAPFDAGTYQWLEFYVRGATGHEKLTVYFHAADGTELCHVPVNDCRHIEGGTIVANQWKRVRIPLTQLNIPQKQLMRLSIQDASGQAATTFWLDDLRLVAAGSSAPAGRVWLSVIAR